MSRDSLLTLASTSYGNVLLLLMNEKELEQVINALMSGIYREYNFKGQDLIDFKELINAAYKDITLNVDKDRVVSNEVLDWSIGVKTLCYFIFTAESRLGRRNIKKYIENDTGNMIDDDINYDWVVSYITWDAKHKEEIESLVNPKPGKGYRKPDRSPKPRAAN